MLFGSTISNAADLMNPVAPEDKCSSRKRRRQVTTTTSTTPRDLCEADDDLLFLEAALLDDDDFDVVDGIEDHEQLKRICRHAAATEEKLSDEVQSLQASVNSMAKDVAKAADKINELRGLISLYMEQQQNVALH